MIEAANEPVAGAEGQRVADDGPEDGDQSHHGKALHHGSEDVLFADQAAVEQGQSGSGHEQDEGSRNQHPGVVGVGLGVGSGYFVGIHGLLQGGDLSLGVGGGGLSEGQGWDCQQDGENEQLDSTTGHKVSTPR